MIEGSCSVEHPAYVGDIADVPTAYLFIERITVLEGFRHIGYLADVPFLDMPEGGGGGRLVGKPEVDGLGEIGVGEWEGRTFVERVYFMGQKDAVPNPEIIHPTLEEGRVVLGTVAEGEEVADVRSQLTRTAGLGDVGNECSVQVNRAVLSTEQSVPSEGDVLPLKKGRDFGGCQARSSPRCLADEPVLGWAGCKKPPVTGL